jgi:hypothetical protein
MMRNHRFARFILLGSWPVLGVGCEDAGSALSASLKGKPSEQGLAAAIDQDGFSRRLREIGISDPGMAGRFFDRLQVAANAENRDALIGMIRFPFIRYYHGIPRRRYDSAAEFRGDFERVFSPKVLGAIKRATFESLFANYQGVMIGDGEVWFDEREDGFRIRAIN